MDSIIPGVIYPESRFVGRLISGLGLVCVPALVLLGFVSMGFYVVPWADKPPHTVAYERMSSICVALNNYADEHDGVYPRTLDEIESDLPEGVSIIDPFTQEPFKYERLEDFRGFMLLSYGSDGVPSGRTIDDEATEDLRFTRGGLYE